MSRWQIVYDALVTVALLIVAALMLGHARRDVAEARQALVEAWRSSVHVVCAKRVHGFNRMILWIIVADTLPLDGRMLRVDTAR